MSSVCTPKHRQSGLAALEGRGIDRRQPGSQPAIQPSIILHLLSSIRLARSLCSVMSMSPC